MSNELISREDLNKQLVKGVGGVAGGIGLWILGGIHIVPGLILSGIVIAAGLGLSSSKKDRTAGILTIAAGALGVLAKFTPFGKVLLGIGGLGLAVVGGISLFKFIKNMNKRK